LSSFNLFKKMAPTSGFYAIYDQESQGIKLVDDQGFEEVKATVTSGKPNIDSIDYEKCRDKMRFKPIVVKRRTLSPNRPTDLIAVYEKSNQSVIAITWAEYEKNKSKYDPGDAPTLKPRPAPAPASVPAPTPAPAPAPEPTLAPAPALAPALTPAFTDAAPVAASKVDPAIFLLPATGPAPAPPKEKQSFASLLFQPPKIGPVTLSPDDLVAAYDPATQSVVAVKRSQFKVLCSKCKKCDKFLF